MPKKVSALSSKNARPSGRMPDPIAANPFASDLDRDPANYQSLTPLTFLDREASVFPERTTIVHGALRRNYSALYTRSRQLA